MATQSQPSAESPFASLAPQAPPAEPPQPDMTVGGGAGAVPVAGDLVGNVAGMKIHLRLTGDMVIRPDGHTGAARGVRPFGLHELEAGEVMPPAPEVGSGQSETEAEDAWDVIKDIALGTSPGGMVVKGYLDAEKHKRAVTALIRAIPDDPDFSKHVPLEYRLDAKEIVDFLLADLGAARTASEPERAHAMTQLAEWGVDVAEALGVELGPLVSPLLAVVGLFVSLGVPYLAANAALAADRARIGFALGAVTSTKGMSAQTIMAQFGHEWSPFGPGAADNAYTVAQTYRLGGLAAGYLQGRRLSANQRSVFWHDLELRTSTTWSADTDPLHWAGVFIKNHLEGD